MAVIEFYPNAPAPRFEGLSLRASFAVGLVLAALLIWIAQAAPNPPSELDWHGNAGRVQTAL
ncbi:MAG: hypothetical protein WBB25_04740 [Sulfitobacter sp.]